MTAHEIESLIRQACFDVNPNVDRQTLVYTKAVARRVLKLREEWK